MNVAEALEGGVARLESHGWAGRHEMIGVQPGCASVAICKARESYDHSDAHQCLAEFIGGKRQVDIFAWNDAPGQTKENVIATMRACAAIWRAKHEERQSEAPVESSAETVSA